MPYRQMISVFYEFEGFDCMEVVQIGCLLIFWNSENQEERIFGTKGMSVSVQDYCASFWREQPGWMP